MAIAAERCVYTNQVFTWEIIQPDGSISGGQNWDHLAALGRKPAVGGGAAEKAGEESGSSNSKSGDSEGSSSSNGSSKKVVRKRSSAGKEADA
jgi:hypothetical protein